MGPRVASTVDQLEAAMLYTLIVILLVLWLLGLLTTYTLSGFIHVLLVLAVVLLIFQLVSGRRPPPV
jgi:hypothetical protein